MADINVVVLVGRLVRDAEMKYTNSGLAICEFSIAVNESRKQGDQWVEEANFFDVTVFGRQGEAIQQYLTKGTQVGVEGRLRQDRWQNQEGQNRSKVTVIAGNVRLLGGRGGSGGAETGEGGENSRNPNRSGAPTNRPRHEYEPSGSNDFPDEIPF